MVDQPTEGQTQESLEAEAREAIEAGPPEDLEGCSITPADATPESFELEEDPDEDELAGIPPVSGGDHAQPIYDGANGRVVTSAVPPPTGILKSEPAVTSGAGLSGLLAGAFLIAKASGLEVTEDMRDGVELFVWSLISFPFWTGLLIRFQVFAPKTAQKLANLSYAKSAAGERPVNVGKPPEGVVE